MFFIAHPGRPGKRAVKRVCVCPQQIECLQAVLQTRIKSATIPQCCTSHGAVSVCLSVYPSVTHILNLSFTHGVVPQQWRCAVVTPVPKVPKPTAISDFRPISFTPLLSRVAERILVRKWNPAIPTYMLADQFGFRPSGSTLCALINMLHHVTVMLENCDYVRCLMTDFSRAFDVVDHPVLLAKLSQLDLPECIQNWIVSFLVRRCQSVKTDCLFSSQQSAAHQQRYSLEIWCGTYAVYCDGR